MLISVYIIGLSGNAVIAVLVPVVIILYAQIIQLMKL